MASAKASGGGASGGSGKLRVGFMSTAKINTKTIMAIRETDTVEVGGRKPSQP